MIVLSTVNIKQSTCQKLENPEGKERYGVSKLTNQKIINYNLYVNLLLQSAYFNSKVVPRMKFSQVLLLK